jgi:hypothetical protein
MQQPLELSVYGAMRFLSAYLLTCLMPYQKPCCNKTVGGPCAFLAINRRQPSDLACFCLFAPKIRNFLQ